MTGGPPVPVTTGLRLMFGASWGDDDVIVFARAAGGLWEVPASGGTPVERTQTNRENGEVGHRLPHVLPGSDAVLYTVTHNRISTAGTKRRCGSIRGDRNPPGC